MNVVCNSSPLIFLGKIGQIGLLSQIFSTVFVSEAVIAELHGMVLLGFIQSKKLTLEGEGFVQGALGHLHRGELATMRLAQELSVELVLLDDLAARRKARRIGLNVMGTLGVLMLANQKELLSREQATLLLHQLRQLHQLYLSRALADEFEAALR